MQYSLTAPLELISGTKPGSWSKSTYEPKEKPLINQGFFLFPHRGFAVISVNAFRYGIYGILSKRALQNALHFSRDFAFASNEV
jgi:hypothetical protein